MSSARGDAVPATAASRRPSRRPRSAGVLALQRMVGNAATARLLARDKASKVPAPPSEPAPTSAPTFRLLIVDDGNSGLAKATLDVALATVRGEMDAVTSESSVDAVKAGFDVHYVSELKPWEPKDLGKRSFIAFLIHDQAAEHWADVAAHHVDLTPSEQKDQEKHIKQQLAAEGGVDVEKHYNRGLIQSAAFVSTAAAQAEEKVDKAGPTSAGRLLGEVIVHELGHALGHTQHEEHGIMQASRTLGSAGPYAPDHFSKASRKLIRERLEWLAAKYAPKSP